MLTNGARLDVERTIHRLCLTVLGQLSINDPSQAGYQSITSANQLASFGRADSRRSRWLASDQNGGGVHPPAAPRK